MPQGSAPGWRPAFVGEPDDQKRRTDSIRAKMDVHVEHEVKEVIMRSSIRLVLSVCLSLSAIFPAVTALAVDGVIEINQACAVNTGCVPGDAAGFPVRITEGGSYRLTSNLDSGSAVVGMIQIQASYVDLDLNGFSVIGPQTCSYEQGSVVCALDFPFAHVLVSSDGAHNTIHDGTIRGALSTGLDLVAPGPHFIDRVHLSENGKNNGAARGLLVSGGAALIRNSVASLNPGEGFEGSATTRFDGNFSYRNGRGFIIGLCSNNTAAENSLQNYGGCTDLGGNSP